MQRLRVRVVIACALVSMAFAAESRSQEITVTLLGTGNSPTAPDRFAVSTLVQAGSQNLVFDSGRGVLQRLVQVGLNAAQVDGVFLTHLHSDHIVGLPELWLSGWFTSNRDRPWMMFGPTGTVSMIDHLQKAFTIDIHSRIEENAPFLPPAGAKIDAIDIKPGVVFEACGFRKF